MRDQRRSPGTHLEATGKMPAPWRLVSPDGVLYHVHSAGDLRALAIEAGIKPFNLEHLVGAQDGNCADPAHAKYW